MNENKRTFVFCDGYVYIRKSKWLPWLKRYYVMKNTQVSVYFKREDARKKKNAIELFTINGGNISPSSVNGLEFHKINEESVHMTTVDTRSELVRWLSAFAQLQAEPDTEPTTKVSFYENVRIRTVPNLSEEEIGKLFYSEEDVMQFSINAYSIRARTGDYFRSILSRKEINNSIPTQQEEAQEHE